MATAIILPAPKGTCPLCARAHDPRDPHDATTLFYGFRFTAIHGRDATWADAIAHCTPGLARAWKQALIDGGHWSEPPEGVEPIAEPCSSIEPGKPIQFAQQTQTVAIGEEA